MDDQAQDAQGRIEELEIRVAFQEEALQTLGQALHEAHQRIERLEAELGSLKMGLEGLRGALRPDASAEPPPPHY
jgi:SlyX protein